MWQPQILGRDRLDGRYSAFLVPAPFAMGPQAPDIIGRRASLEDGEYLIRGVLSKMPAGPISAGEPILLLVRLP